MTDIQKENKSGGKVPNLRFPNFYGEWEVKTLGKIMDFKVTNSFSRENLNYEYGKVKNIHYGDIHTKFQTLFDINYESVPFINEEIDISRISDENYCKNGDIVFADASEDLNDVGKSIEIINTNGEKLLSGLHTLLARPKQDVFHLGFSGYLFKSNSVRVQIQKESQGSKVLSINVGRISKVELSFPPVEEQRKITSFLSLIDSRIKTQNKIINDLKTLKTTLSKKIFSQELRFKDDKGNEFLEWENILLGDTLDYEQPTNYLVSSTEYDDSFEIPVVTAGKTFILGYTDEKKGVFEKEKLPVIIFDDFTTASQFVDFPFKAKSSAMKILKAKNDTNIRFIFEALQMINYEVGGHGRHWISVFSNLSISVPSLPEQTKIANFLSAIDSKIDMENQLLQKLEEQKKYLLQNMFV